MKKFMFALCLLGLWSSASQACQESSLVTPVRDSGAEVTYDTQEGARFRVAELRDIVDNLDGERQYNPCTRDEYIAELENLLSQYPTLPEALVLRARMGLMNTDNPNPDFLAAKVWIDRSLSHNPQDAESYVLLGHILANLGEMDDAVDALDKADSLGSTSPWVRLNRANIDRLSGNMINAMRRYQEVAHDETVRPRERAFAFSMLAQDAVAKKDWEKAQSLLHSQTELEPTHIGSAWAHGNFAINLLKAGRYQQAIDSARYALSIREYGNGHLILTAGLYLLAIDDHLRNGKLSPEGLRAFDEAYTREPAFEEVVVLVTNYQANDEIHNGLNALFYAPESLTGVPKRTASAN